MVVRCSMVRVYQEGVGVVQNPERQNNLSSRESTVAESVCTGVNQVGEER